LHTTNLLSGLMFIAIGILFIVSEGTSSLEGLYASGGATDLAFFVERWAENLGGTIPSIMFAGLGLLFAGLLLYGLARRRNKKPVERGS
jgi:LPXTG-motif cell wall-anchored protein